jgi:uncharacterized protein
VIADLHSGGPNMLVPHVQHVIDTANGLNSDLVVLLGDYIARTGSRPSACPTDDWRPSLRGLGLARRLGDPRQS